MESQLVADAQAIYQAALIGVQPAALLQKVAWLHDSKALEYYARIFVIGAGKASMAMAGQVEALLGNRITEGMVTVPHGYSTTLPAYLPAPQRIRIREAGHPVPDMAGEHAAAEALSLAAQAGVNDLIIALISGGGSALWPAPVQGLTLADMQVIGRLLLRSGADIHRVNTIRKHLSRIKGGQLIRVAAPATLQALVISDVVGDDLSVIASGPTVPDATSFGDAVRFLQEANMWKHIPARVQHHLEVGQVSGLAETPKPSDRMFERASTHLVGTNHSALEAAAVEAIRRGYQPQIVTNRQIGEARKVGTLQALHMLDQGNAKGSCFLWGGETTVTVTGAGKGGRNQELVLSAAHVLDKVQEEVILLSGGTDGIDGPTDAAGAWATPHTLETARRQGLSASAFLDNNDAYSFFSAINSLLKPGPTHTNVMDIQIGLIGHL